MLDGHVLCQFVDVDGLADGHGTCEPLVEGHALGVLVLVLTIKYAHNPVVFYMVLDTSCDQLHRVAASRKSK